MAALFAPHNEHRIVFTRLLDIVLLEVGGQWDPRLQMAIDTFVLLLGVYILLRHTSSILTPIQQVALSVVCVIFFSSTTSWENALNGFQSQFYFLILFSLLHLLLTIGARPFSSRWWFGNIAGLCNLFTMAPGLLSAPAILGWLVWRRYRYGTKEKGDVSTTLWNLSLIIVGFLMIPRPTLPVGSTQQPLSHMSQIFLHLLSWPVVDWKFGLLVWAPAILFLCVGFFVPKLIGNRGWLLGLIFFELGIMLATMIGRGGFASRYVDLFSIGILVNWLCLITWPTKSRWNIVMAVSSTFWLALVIQALWHQEQLSYEITLTHEVQLSQDRASAIRRFISSGDSVFLRQCDQFSELDISMLELARKDESVLRILPFSIRSPIPVDIISNSSSFAAGNAPKPLNAMPDLPFWGNWGSSSKNAEGEWRSAPIQTPGGLIVFFVFGEIAPPFTELYLESIDGEKIPPTYQPTSAQARWFRVNFVNPNKPFQIVARTRGIDHWLAFSAPMESTWGSWLAGKFLRLLSYGTNLYALGWIVLMCLALQITFNWLNADKTGSAGIVGQILDGRN
jgi:hypothetical protein